MGQFLWKNLLKYWGCLSLLNWISFFMRPYMSGVVVLDPTWNCYINKKKLICRTAVPSFAASLEPLIHRRNDASLSLFYRNCFSRCSSELAQLVPLSYFFGRSPVYSDRLHDFSITIPRCCKDVYFNSFFPRTTRL